MFDLYRMSATPNPRTILRKQEVLRRTGLRTTRLYELIKLGEFAAQVSLGARAVGWYEDEVQAWIDNRPATDARKGRSGDDTQAVRSDKRGENLHRNRVDKELIAAVETARNELPDRSSNAAPARRPTSDAPTSRHNTMPASPDSRETEKLKRMGDENSRLKVLIANLMLENDALRTAIGGGKSAA
jgi:prophage regulatory protein